MQLAFYMWAEPNAETDLKTIQLHTTQDRGNKSTLHRAAHRRKKLSAKWKPNIVVCNTYTSPNGHLFLNWIQRMCCICNAKAAARPSSIRSGQADRLSKARLKVRQLPHAQLLIGKHAGKRGLLRIIRGINRWQQLLQTWIAFKTLT